MLRMDKVCGSLFSWADQDKLLNPFKPFDWILALQAKWKQRCLELREEVQKLRAQISQAKEVQEYGTVVDWGGESSTSMRDQLDSMQQQLQEAEEKRKAEAAKAKDRLKVPK